MEISSMPWKFAWNMQTRDLWSAIECKWRISRRFSRLCNEIGNDACLRSKISLLLFALQPMSICTDVVEAAEDEHTPGRLSCLLASPLRRHGWSVPQRNGWLVASFAHGRPWIAVTLSSVSSVTMKVMCSFGSGWLQNFFRLRLHHNEDLSCRQGLLLCNRSIFLVWRLST
jgi:hypothetical protein